MNMRVYLIALVTAVTFSYQNCSQTKFSNPASGRAPSRSAAGIGLSDGKDPGMPAANGGTTTDNPKPTVDIVMAGFDNSQVQNVQLCVDQVKFYKTRSLESANPNGADRAHGVQSVVSLSGEHVLIRVGRHSVSQDLGGVAVSLSPQSTVLNSLAIPPGNYQQVDIQLRPSCAFGSFSFINQAGKQLTLDHQVTLQFKGNITLNPGDPQVMLNVARLMAALAPATSSSQLEQILNSNSGDM